MGLHYRGLIRRYALQRHDYRMGVSEALICM